MNEFEHQKERREAWDRYAAAAIVHEKSTILACATADRILEQRDRRWPGPQIAIKSGQATKKM